MITTRSGVAARTSSQLAGPVTGRPPAIATISGTQRSAATSGLVRAATNTARRGSFTTAASTASIGFWIESITSGARADTPIAAASSTIVISISTTRVGAIGDGRAPGADTRSCSASWITSCGRSSRPTSAAPSPSAVTISAPAALGDQIRRLTGFA